VVAAAIHMTVNRGAHDAVSFAAARCEYMYLHIVDTYAAYTGFIDCSF